MGAKIYSAPAEVGEPPRWVFEAGKPFDLKEAQRKDTEWAEKVIAWAKKNTRNPNSDLVGMVYRYGVGDGYAQYVVLNTKPLEVIHLPLGDAWHIPDVVRRGLTIADLKEELVRQEAYKKIFGETVP